MRFLVLTTVVGCGWNYEHAERDPGSSYSSIDTGIWIDTSEPDTGDTGDTGEPVESDIASVALYPDGLTVHAGASWPLRMIGTWDDGHVADLSLGDVIWSSDDQDVLSVDKAGMVTAVGVGSATLTGEVESHSATVSATVTDDGMVTVQVVDALTGEPVQSAKLKVFEGDVFTSSADGLIEAPVDDGGPIAISVYLSGYIPVTVWGTISREMTIPLHTDADFNPEASTVSGAGNFENVDDGGISDMVIGLVVPSFQAGPLLMEPANLLSANRSVTIYGIDANVPSNLMVQEHAENFEAPAHPGTVAVWGMAGALPISEVTSGLNGTDEAIELLRDNLDVMSWGWSEVGSLEAGESHEMVFSPSVGFSSAQTVQVGDLPLGFSGDEDPLVMIGEWLPGSGAVVTGLGLGTGDVVVQLAPEAIEGSERTIAMVVAQVDGLGSEGATCAAWADVSDDADVVLPALQEVPVVESFDAITHEFALSSDARSSYVRVLIESSSGTQRMMYMASGAQAGEMPNPGFPMGYGNTQWTVLAMETQANTFEGMVSGGDLLARELALRSWTSSRVGQNFSN